MPPRILLCSDLDRTLLPNGLQPESPQARPLLRRLATHPGLTLAYISGRHLALIEAAIQEYELPRPHFAVGDVGTSIYRPAAEDWVLWDVWSQRIAADWNGYTRDDLQQWLDDIADIALQEPEKQNQFKLSYYASTHIDRAALLATVRARLTKHQVQAELVWSVDETQDLGLFDVLPASATKLGAMRFLMQELGFDSSNSVFAGDSGNDIPVLISGIPAILVANATPEVRAEAQAGRQKNLYLAQGGWREMNGHYSAGVLEGLIHFHPELAAWLDRLG